MKRLALLLSLVAIVITAVIVGLQWGAPAPLTPSSRAVAVASPAITPSVKEMRGPEDIQALTEPLTGVQQAAVPSSQASAVSPAPLEGPAKIEAWLASSTDAATVANNILAGYPSLKPGDQLLAVSKLSALVSDDRFESLKPLIFDLKTTNEAKEFLFRDALGRAESLKLPLLLRIMQTPDHPCASEARQTLTTQLGVDYGMNYGQWQAKINEVLRAQ